MEVRLEMAIRRRRCQRKSHFANADEDLLPAFVIDEEVLRPLTEGRLFGRSQVVIANSERAPEQGSDWFVVFGFVNPAVDLKVPGIGLQVMASDSREKNHGFVRLQSGPVSATNKRKEMHRKDPEGAKG